MAKQSAACRSTRTLWLPVAGGKTYPDFVAKLKDGRLLVVEYKGDQLLAASLEKRMIGELWQRASAGKGVYVMAQALLDGMDVRAQLRAAPA